MIHSSAVRLICLLGFSLLTSCAVRGELLSREVGHATVYGYQDTPLLPWTDGRYHVHDLDRPLPAYVVPVLSPISPPISLIGADASDLHPADATVLFDGGGLHRWKSSSWKVNNGLVEAGEGNLKTKESYGDCQLHLEWMVPTELSKDKMNRGNSGVMIMGLYEVQIFDSWHEHLERIYPDGQAAAIYGQTPPLVNVCQPPGQWQSFDIFFTAPRFQDGKLRQRAVITMLHNGVVVHLNQTIFGQVAHRDLPVSQSHPSKLPLELQAHHCPVRFRNIWIRDLQVDTGME